MDPKNLRYAATHEWANLDGDVCTVGITKFAVEQLTDVVYIELPDVGDNVFSGDGFGEIESVKAVSDLYSPVDGEGDCHQRQAGKDVVADIRKFNVNPRR